MSGTPEVSPPPEDKLVLNKDKPEEEKPATSSSSSATNANDSTTGDNKTGTMTDENKDAKDEPADDSASYQLQMCLGLEECRVCHAGFA